MSADACPPCDEGHQHEYDDDYPHEPDCAREYGYASLIGAPCVWCDHEKCADCPPPRPIPSGGAS